MIFYNKYDINKKHMQDSITYSKISKELLRDLPPRVKEVVSRRFGLGTGQEETLEAIGKSHGITRERVRQIERTGISKIKEKADQYRKIFDCIISYLKNNGGLKREDILLSQLGDKRFQPQVSFLLNINDQFSYFPENDRFFSFWAVSDDAENKAQKIIASLVKKLEEKKEPFPLDEIYKIYPDKKYLDLPAFNSFIEISKDIEQGIDNLYGLSYWPSVRPRGLKDKAFLALKKEGKPLHFRQIASAIDNLNFSNNFDKKGKTVFQTVHNELIKDPRFVLVGRGIYALSEWGYVPGYVKDVIFKVLKDKKKPQTKEEIVREVLKQRFVKESTIFLNLQNKKYFLRDSNSKYTFRLD